MRERDDRGWKEWERRDECVGARVDDDEVSDGLGDDEVRAVAADDDDDDVVIEVGADVRVSRSVLGDDRWWY